MRAGSYGDRLGASAEGARGRAGTGRMGLSYDRGAGVSQQNLDYMKQRDETLKQRLQGKARNIAEYQQMRARELELENSLTRRFRVPPQGGVPSPRTVPAPRVQFPLRIPNLLRVPVTGLPVDIALQLLFPDPVNEGEDEFLERMKDGAESEFKPFEYPTESGVAYRVYVAVHNARSEVEKVVYGDPNFGGEPWQYYWLYDLVPGEIIGVRKRGSYSEALGTPPLRKTYRGYRDFEILSEGFDPAKTWQNDQRITRIISSGTGSFDAAFILALVPVSVRLPVIDREGNMELPEDGEIIIPAGGFGGFEMEPPKTDPVTGIKLKPRWRIPPFPTPVPNPVPKPPWREWDDPERPPTIPIQDVEKFPKIDFPPIPFPLPPFEEFPDPRKQGEGNDEQCRPGEDCMNCRFNAAIIQAMVTKAKVDVELAVLASQRQVTLRIIEETKPIPDKVVDKLGTQIEVDVFNDDKQKTEKQKLQFLATSKTVSGVQVGFQEIAKIRRNKPVATVPDRVRTITADSKPQMVILYQTDKGDAYYQTCIPWAVNRKPPSVPYKKGNIMVILELEEGGKMVINASTEAEGRRVINALKSMILPAKLTNSTIRVTKRNDGIKEVSVKPNRADFYEKGHQGGITPDSRYFYD